MSCVRIEVVVVGKPNAIITYFPRPYYLSKSFATCCSLLPNYHLQHPVQKKYIRQVINWGRQRSVMTYHSGWEFIHSAGDRIKRHKIINPIGHEDVTTSIIMQPWESLHLCIRVGPTTESIKVIIHPTGTDFFPLRGGIIETEI